MSIKPTPRACFLRPDIRFEAYFFKDNEYVRINVGEDEIAYGPANIQAAWPPLKEVGFKTVTATVAPGHDPHDVYFFEGKKCALIKVIPEGSRGYVVHGPAPTTEMWPPLRRVGWDTIDAACQGRVEMGEIYFFKGSQFIVVQLDPSGEKDGEVKGPKDIKGTWKETGFDRVDSVLPNFADSNEAYFFSGTKCALVDLASGGVIDGPHKVTNEWNSLRAAGFY